MSVLMFSDSDGDAVAVEHTAIVAVSVGSLSGPSRDGAPLRVTLVHLLGGDKLVVVDPFETVLDEWETAIANGLPSRPLEAGRALAYPLVTHQYPEITTPLTGGTK